MGILRQISLFDSETGELISSDQRLVGTRLKEGWIVVYKEALKKLLKEAPNYATLKFYLYVATAQDYDTVTLITTPFIAKEAGMNYQTAWRATKWLIENGYIRRANVNGNEGFIVNPLVSTCGRKNYQEKLAAFEEAVVSISPKELKKFKDAEGHSVTVDVLFGSDEDVQNAILGKGVEEISIDEEIDDDVFEG